MYTGKDIKEIRIKLGLKQISFAKKLGTKVYSVRYWEQNPTAQIKPKYHSILKDMIENNIYDENEKKVDEGFYKKIKDNLAKISFLRDAVSLYFATQDPEIPTLKKAVVYAALAYFIIPIDAIPDIIPITGFIDDAAMITGAVTVLGSMITQDHRDKAEEWLDNF